MASTPTFYAAGNRWERGDDLSYISVAIPDPGGDQRITLFRPAAAGRIVAARWVPDSTLSAGTADYYSVALHNGGTFTAGTAATVICAAVGGTAAGGTAPGWVADTDTNLPVTGTATFVANEAIVLVYDEEGTVAPSGRVQVAYRLDP